ncbi:hypothetical protein ACIBF5_04985 [Micromonospora sp. NPDC050417]|uniref:hypothetical protein n=1 Tax=Micromonospora sp. NPDC050417 TaxID=3364280 RepID=UPI0037A060ED
MRLTVGPLSPAVYWRRRAVVLGAALLFLIVVLWSCTGPGNTDPNAGKGTPNTTPTGTPSPTATVLTPQTGTPPPSEGAEDPGPGGTDPSAAGDPGLPAGDPGPPPAGTVPEVPPPAAGSCTDEEISVVPAALSKSIRQGDTVGLQLKVKNISDRTCSRDLGADLQELFIKRGAEKVWSSDTCGIKGTSVVSLVPNVEHTFQADWNGNRDTKCSGTAASGPDAEPGEYQIFARLGTKHSDPVTFTITN